jgi:uncharacterized protein YjbI with pentapeptide repeats
MLRDTRPFKTWSSPTGIRLLRRLLRREVSLGDVERDLHLPGWELVLINRAIWRPKRRRRSDRGGSANVTRAVRALAEELDVFRTGSSPSAELLDRLHQIDETDFQGRRSHLVRVFAFQESHEQWNRWRSRTGEVPDLRGGNLGDLDLRFLDLTGARLRGANLSAAMIRTGQLRSADLRDSNLRHTDLSYADLRGAKLRNAQLNHTLLTGADLRGADLRRAFLVGTALNQARLQGADLTGAVVWGVGAWDMEFDARTRQQGLIVAPGLEPLDYIPQAYLRGKDRIRVNDLDVAHFVSLLIENPRIGRVINAAAERVVLLLGRFVGRERRVLAALRQALPDFGYVPVVFDFEEPDNRDTIETVSILAGLSSFVIADLSQPRSTPLEAHLVIPSIAVPFVPIVRAGEAPFSMFTALQRKYRWVLPTVPYRSEASLVRKLRTAVIEPAERAAAMIRRLKHPKARSS